jgi:putative transcriptional regulator
MNHIPKVWTRGSETTKDPVLYQGCGLDDIWLVSGYEIEIIDGDPAISVSDLDGLHEAIGRALVRRKKILSGKEIRFLRQQMDLTQSKMARLVGCDTQQVARYEKGQNKMPGAVDRLLRMLYREHLNDQFFVQAFLEAVDEMDSRMSDKQVFAETADGWQTAA